MESAEQAGTTDEDDIDQELLVEAEAAWAQREWTIQHVFVSIHAAFPQASEVNGGRWDVCSGCFSRQAVQDLGEMLVDTGHHKIEKEGSLAPCCWFLLGRVPYDLGSVVNIYLKKRAKLNSSSVWIEIPKKCVNILAM